MLEPMTACHCGFSRSTSGIVEVSIAEVLEVDAAIGGWSVFEIVVDCA